MATINYFLYSKTEGKQADIFVRLSVSKKNDFIVKTGETIDPKEWKEFNKKVPSDIESERRMQYLDDLKSFIGKEIKNYFRDFSKEWLTEVVYRFKHKKSSDAETFMEYIVRFIAEAESGSRKNEDGMNLSKGTITNLKAFKDRLIDYQDNRSEKLKRSIKIDFENVVIDFYNDFVSYLSDEGYAQNTIGKHIKTLKMFMSKSLEEKKHTNRDFQFRSFKGISRKSFNVYLTEQELDVLYNKDLTDNPDYDKARDAFLVLCETGLRISDYSKVDVSIKSKENGRKFIHLTQAKTDGEVVIPVSARLDKILNKHNGTLPKVRDQYINRDIKKVAELCEFNEVLRWNERKLGKSYEKTCKKWKKISCHTGRRTFCTNAYLAGIEPLKIMMISGHSTESNFLKYIKISKEQNATLLADHPHFTKLTIAN